VQESWQKAFVLLQASVARLHIEDYSLRQEMNSMVDYASRMLSAVEEFSIHGSRHGQVALQGLRLRRSLVTCLWNAQDGILNQLSGVGAKTTAALKFNGINTFEDVIAASNEQIEKAAQRAQPFGSNLRSIVSRILLSTLKLNACIQYAHGSSTPSSVICNISARDDLSALDSSLQSQGSAEVSYTLIAYTDRPGGILKFKRDISTPETLVFNTTPVFGKITIILLASLVGLDDRVEIQGNDDLASTALSSGAKQTLRNSTMPSGKRKIRNLQQSFLPTTTEKTNLHSTLAHQNIVSAKRPRMNSQTNVLSSVTPSPTNLIIANQGVAIMNTAAAIDQSSYQHRTPAAPKQGQSHCASKLRENHEQTSPKYRPICDTNEGLASLGNGDICEAPLATRESLRSFQRLSEIPQAHLDSQYKASSYPAHVTHVARAQRPPDSRSPKQAPFPFALSPATQLNWQKARKAQAKTQSLTKKEYLFSHYKHDPNDAEETLDTIYLNRSPQMSVIPAAGLRALANAYNSVPYRDNHSTRVIHHDRADFLATRTPNMSGAATLTLKADECNWSLATLDPNRGISMRPQNSPFFSDNSIASHQYQAYGVSDHNPCFKKTIQVNQESQINTYHPTTSPRFSTHRQPDPCQIKSLHHGLQHKAEHGTYSNYYPSTHNGHVVGTSEEQFDAHSSDPCSRQQVHPSQQRDQGPTDEDAFFI
jgi:hypothetical protein